MSIVNLYAAAGLLEIEWRLGTLEILNGVLDWFGMPREGAMNSGYEFCRNRWTQRWAKLARQEWNPKTEHAAVMDFLRDAADWNSDSQIATSNRKRHSPQCPSANNA